MSSRDAFEYRVLELESSLGGFGSTSVPVEKLNDLGAEGWEVTAPLTNKSGETEGFLLKRPR